MSNKIEISSVNAHYNVAGTRILKYSVEMYHSGLNIHKLITAPEHDILNNKINVLEENWTKKWELFKDKRRISQNKEAQKNEANQKTKDAIKEAKVIDNLLIHTLSVDDTVNWNSLKRADDFPERKPKRPKLKAKKKYPSEPVKEAIQFTIIQKLFKSKKEKRIQQNNEKYLSNISLWEEEKKSVDNLNLDLENEHQISLIQWEKDINKWDNKKLSFYQKQAEFNKKITHLEEKYFSNNPDSIMEYCEMVLNNSEYPDSFPQNFELEYNPDNKILIVEYELPNISNLPELKEVKYIAARNELKEICITDNQKLKMFDEALYKITLRTLHEIFEADAANAIDAISFNGRIKAINKATGKEENNCIISIQAKKGEFIEIDLMQIDPKSCFKGLKGIAASKLSTITPIQPILQIISDKRIVDSYDVTSQIDDSTNIAAMDWEDFEHLVREIFEKEFKVNGGEVNVTQASRDGGVDAIAFDPDPIRGGKIVIQAKRYTNTVGVAAVRDLYGTVVNEGATKGILVSTADYGPDSYNFAKGKPLTLLNGSNLLHLLEKHGHNAKIDLKEAKQILADNN